MEDQERIEEQDEDVEGHGRRKGHFETDEPTDELAESDDVEAHRKHKGF